MKWYLILVALSSPTEPKTLPLEEVYDSLEACESSFMYQHYQPPREGAGTICLPYPRPTGR